jgi:hypothetical protein
VESAFNTSDSKASKVTRIIAEAFEATSIFSATKSDVRSQRQTDDGRERESEKEKIGDGGDRNIEDEDSNRKKEYRRRRFSVRTTIESTMVRTVKKVRGKRGSNNIY